jgi:hypothetical protein
MFLKRMIQLAIVAAAIVALSGCEEAGTSTPSPARLRHLNNTSSLQYYNIGTQVDSNTADLVGSWVAVNPGSTSAYQEIDGGSYTMYYDDDADHVSFSRFSSDTWELEDEKKYLMTVNDSTYSVMEE